MSRISDLKIEDIIFQIGVKLEDRDLGVTFNYDEQAIEEIRELMRRFDNEPLITESIKRESMLREFKKFEGVIDKEKFVLLTLYNMQTKMEQGRDFYSKDTIKDIRTNISNAIKLLGKSDINVVSFTYDKDKGALGRINVLNSNELIRCIKARKPISTIFETSRKQEERMKAVDRMLGGLSTVASCFTHDDIAKTICKDEQIGEALLKVILDRTFSDFAADNSGRKEDLLELFNQGGPLKDEVEQEIIQRHYQEEGIASVLIQNCKYVDIDKLLLIVGYRLIEDLEYDTVDAKNYDENNDNVKLKEEEYMSILEEMIRSISREISKRTKVEKLETREGELIIATTEGLQENTKKFINGRYVRESELEQTRRELKEGEKTFEDIQPEIRDILGFSNEDIINIAAKHSRNLAVLIKEGSIEEGQIDLCIDKMDKIPDDTLEILLQKDMIQLERIMELFEQGKIDTLQMKRLEIDKKLDPDVINSKIKDLYTEMNSRDKSEEDKSDLLAKFIRYVGLYRVLNIEEKSEEEINNNGSKLISNFEEELDDKTLQDLYQYGLITLDIAADWGINLSDMILKDQVRPTDFKKLYANGLINLEQIKKILLDDSLTNDSKQDLIYSTFDGDTLEDENIRNELIQLLTKGESYKGESINSEVKRGKGDINNRREYITDPQTRWRLISLIDKDYSKKFLAAGKDVIDGHRVFYLPNLGKILIERMYENRKGVMVNAYGSATYIMDPDTFFEEADNILIEGAINRSYLRELTESEKAKKIIHSKFWGKNLMNYLDVNYDNERYTEEDIRQIENAAERVSKSRRERE